MEYIPAKQAMRDRPALILEAGNRLSYALIGCLYGTSAILLITENYSYSWLWLFLFLCLALLEVLHLFLPARQHAWALALTFMQGAMIMLLAFFMKGYGSIPLMIPMQINLVRQLNRKASPLFSAGFFSALTLILYHTQELSSPYPAVFLGLAWLTTLLLLLMIKDSAALNQTDITRISELQSSKKALRDMNLKMKRYDEEMEKVTVLRERNRMTKKMHDTLGHVLTAVSVQLQAAELLVSKDPKEAAEKIRNAKVLAKEGLAGIRQALSQIDEDHLQFEDRLRDVMAKAEAAMGIKFLSQISAQGSLPLPVQEFLAAALREGITNGVRHGGATAFVFRLHCEDGSIHFYLEDNGHGCEKIHTGYGLMAMEKQAEALGGALICHSVRDEGFVLKLKLPSGRNQS